jgi:hypothetical protein
VRCGALHHDPTVARPATKPGAARGTSWENQRIFTSTRILTQSKCPICGGQLLLSVRAAHEGAATTERHIMNTTRNPESIHVLGWPTKSAARVILAAAAGATALGLGAGTANADPVQQIRCPDHLEIGYNGPPGTGGRHPEPFTVELVNWDKGGTVYVEYSTPHAWVGVGQAEIDGSPQPGAVTYLRLTVEEPIDTLYAHEVVGRGDSRRTLQASCHMQLQYWH